MKHGKNLTFTAAMIFSLLLSGCKNKGNKDMPQEKLTEKLTATAQDLANAEAKGMIDWRGVERVGSFASGMFHGSVVQYTNGDMEFFPHYHGNNDSTIASYADIGAIKVQLFNRKNGKPFEYNTVPQGTEEVILKAILPEWMEIPEGGAVMFLNIRENVGWLAMLPQNGISHDYRQR